MKTKMLKAAATWLILTIPAVTFSVEQTQPELLFLESSDSPSDARKGILSRQEMKTKKMAIFVYLLISLIVSDIGFASQPLVLDKSTPSLFDSLIVGHRFYKDLETYQNRSTELADATEEMWEEQHKWFSKDRPWKDRK